ncbi:sperm-specific sodium:proton exchanger-like isoform X2 [Plodia interpunctella]|uniref:sperm-specific sodium:proton exchanger-like isoform X2 n=1 Tax=Plodia interpunctella TaxID=58824 RepID=UPI002368917C|nr:sodium/hydrogen exchanger 10-like isoform X2 [Plodia interpunctella]
MPLSKKFCPYLYTVILNIYTAVDINQSITMYTILLLTLISSVYGEEDEAAVTELNNTTAIPIFDGRPSQAYPPLLGFLFLFSIILIGAAVRGLMLWTSLDCVPYRVVMFALGGLLGFFASKYAEFRPFVEVCYVDVDILLTIFLPVLVFNTAYSVDSHSFWRCFPQILLVGVPGAIMTALMCGFIAYHLVDATWSFPMAMLFGVICSPIYPMGVVRRMKEMTKGKYMSVLLQGEGLIGDSTVMIEFTVVFGYIAMAVTEPSQIALLITRYAGGGILMGILMGKISGTLLTLTYYDLLSSVAITIAAAYLTYYIGEKFFYISGLLATTIAGVLVSNIKSTIAGDVEQVLSNFWMILAHTANTLVFTMIGVVIFDKVYDVISVRQAALILVTYMTVYCARFIMYACMMPLLQRIGYGISWQHCLAGVWGGLRGPLSMSLALIVIQTPSVADAGEVFIIQTAGLVLFSLLINATSMNKVLKLLGLAEISLAKKANMTNCVKRIMLTRDRCISMLKMDKFLADANWDLVQEGTEIKHPYQLQISGRDEDNEDDTYMGYRYTTCPDCERDIPNEPTKKEFAEMMREANQRVLKAMKISYWRQYEHGKISKEGVRTLVQAVEVAADSDDARINLEQLGTLWKPKAHAVWLRHKMVDMMTPEAANAQVPRHPWRQVCYRIVTNVWFDTFIYLMILLNTPVILCEVLMKPPVSQVTMFTIKGLNFFFFIVYVMEIILKMIAYGFCGYFKSNWNKLDFFIVVMATGDLVLDIIDSLTPWDKWKNMNSNILTATKLLRMLRFIRLCKLAKVSVPKFMAYIDKMIDIQLAFGYDVGKGFVTGEQEVCTLLPQLVDNKLIQETLNAKLEADRLAVTRQLGLLQRDRPWTAITVKTRQATTSTLNIMLLDAMQLKEEGFLDEMEYRLLVHAIQVKVQQCRHRDSLVAPSSPEVLTNRPYNYTLRCDSAVQAYHITMPVIKEAFNLAPHPIMGLEAAMWREIGIKLSMMVLPSVPAYHGWSVERLSMRLEHSFVPCLKPFKVFVVNELMEDIILLDGICQDMATREIFQPPCYIPRTAHRLIFPKSSQLMVSNSCPETKLLIVPAKDTDELDIMEDEVDDLQCELISNASSRCLYHRVAHKLSNESTRVRDRRGRKRRRGTRRVNYRESVWGKAQNTSDRELSAAVSRYYKGSTADMFEPQAGSTKRNNNNMISTFSPEMSMRQLRSEQEIYNTMFTKNKRHSMERINDILELDEPE